MQEKGRALLLKVVSKGGESSLLTSRAGAQGASPHPGPQLRCQAPGAVLQTTIHPRVVPPGGLGRG